MLLVAGVVHADNVTVPLDLQVQLLARVVRYERGFASRGAAPARLLVLVDRNNAESQRVAAQLGAALTRAGNLGGRAVAVVRHEYTGEQALGAALTAEPPDILYIAAGLTDRIPAITRVVGSRPILTVSAIGSDVDQGIVLGFELVASRPQIAVNLPHARTQQLDFSAQLLRLARVVR